MPFLRKQQYTYSLSSNDCWGYFFLPNKPDSCYIHI